MADMTPDNSPDHTTHIVSSYEGELQRLSQLIARMGEMVVAAARNSLDALTSANLDLATRIVQMDPEVDGLQRQIEDLAISIIARRQPMAVDLRQIMSSIRICIDLERIGDMAKNVAKRIRKMEGGYLHLSSIPALRELFDLVNHQIAEVVAAYNQRDFQKAIEVWRSDEQIDTLHSGVIKQLLQEMMADKNNVPVCTNLLFCTKNIERIGDHATNIAENVHYFVKGQHLPDDRPRGGVSGPETSPATES